MLFEGRGSEPLRPAGQKDIIKNFLASSTFRVFCASRLNHLALFPPTFATIDFSPLDVSGPPSSPPSQKVEPLEDTSLPSRPFVVDSTSKAPSNRLINHVAVTTNWSSDQLRDRDPLLLSVDNYSPYTSDEDEDEEGDRDEKEEEGEECVRSV